MRINLILALLLAAMPAAAETASGLKTEFYGFIKTDLIYSDHGTYTNEYRVYVTGGRADRAFRASARASRLGVNLSSGPVSGKLEADFLGLTDSVGGAAGTVSDLRLRQAYAAVKAGRTEILAGQTYYPITADIPETLNDYYLGNSGALWSRAPQLRATLQAPAGIKLIAAVVRPTAKLTDAEGTHSARPSYQAKLEKTIGKARFSLAGAAGVWKSTSTQKEADVSVTVAGFNVPWSVFTVYGEAWTGRNLTDFLGGLGNSGYAENGVRSSGGYLALKAKPSADLWFTAAYGVDDPKNARVAAGGKDRNSTALINGVVKLYGMVETGLEISELRTCYKGQPDRSAMNYQLTFKLIF